ncbi:MAG: LamG domain-containing protein [Saprospiraceae bacterium]|nr:LamG domain-containing protein [Saprospiraceae bacterium]
MKRNLLSRLKNHYSNGSLTPTLSLLVLWLSLPSVIQAQTGFMNPNSTTVSSINVSDPSFTDPTTRNYRLVPYVNGKPDPKFFGSANGVVYPQGIQGSALYSVDKEKALAAGRKALTEIPVSKYLYFKAGQPFQIDMLTRATSMGFNIKTTGFRSALVGTVADSAAIPNYLSPNLIAPTMVSRLKPNTGNPFMDDSQTTECQTRFTLNFPLGTKKGFVAINCIDEVVGQKSTYTIVLPFIIEGQLQTEVPILGTVTRPQIPFTVLHLPPGDGSYVEYKANKTVCRGLEETSTIANSGSSNVGVKLGFKGSVGLIATVDIEAYVKFNVGYSGGASEVKMNSKETCLTSGSSIVAKVPSGVDRENADLFVGYGYDEEWGIADMISVENGVVKQTRSKIISPTKVIAFRKTTSDIKTDIQTLNTIKNNTANPMKMRADAENQIAIWNRFLFLNDSCKKAANQPFSGALGIYKGGNGEQSQTLSTETRGSYTVQIEKYAEITGGIEGVVEVGGSGVSANSEFKSTLTFGSTNTNTKSDGNEISYTLSDDEDDVYKMTTYIDPMWGTPIFKVDAAATKSSCPYTEGIRRDLPSLTNGTPNVPNPKEIRRTGIPRGASISVPLKICNKSPEPRKYRINLDGQSNIYGAVFRLGGTTINTTTDGVYYDVAANDCSNVGGQFPQLTINPGPNLTVTKYQGIRLLMYSDCEPDIVDTLMVNLEYTTGGTNGTTGGGTTGGGTTGGGTTSGGTKVSLGNALNFDGKDDCVLIRNTNTPLTNTEALTIEYWFKGSTLHSAVRLQPDNKSHIITGYNGSHFVRLNYVDYTVPVGGNATDGTWHHVAMTWQRNSPTGFKSYLDGVLISEKQTPDLPLPIITSGAWLGSLSGGAEYTKGSLDEVRIWSVVKSQAEIKANMFSDLPAQNNLILYYQFNQGTAGGTNTDVNTLTNKANSSTFLGILNNFGLTGTSSNWIACEVIKH